MPKVIKNGVLCDLPIEDAYATRDVALESMDRLIANASASEVQMLEWDREKLANDYNQWIAANYGDQG